MSRITLIFKMKIPGKTLGFLEILIFSGTASLGDLYGEVKTPVLCSCNQLLVSVGENLSCKIYPNSEVTSISQVFRNPLSGWFRYGIIYYVRKIFRKTNISYPLIRTRTCTYQGVRNVSFSENFAYVVNEWSLFINSVGNMFPSHAFTRHSTLTGHVFS